MSLSPADSKEIEKIRDALRPSEQVLSVAKQSRIAPGGTLTTPNTIFATNQRLILRNPSMLGLRASIEDYPYSAITAVKIQKGLFSSKIFITVPGLDQVGKLMRWGRREEGEIDALPHNKAKELQRIINEGIAGRLPGQAPPKPVTPAVAPISPIDEIKKLAELRDAGVITEEEF